MATATQARVPNFNQSPVKKAIPIRRRVISKNTKDGIQIKTGDF